MSTTTSDPTQPPPHPPIGSVCWIEILSKDPPKLKDFYASLFPAWIWNPAQDEPQTEVVHYKFSQPQGLSGGIVKRSEDCAPAEQAMGAGMTVYYFVESIDKIEGEIERAGGKKCFGKTEQGDMGWFANFRDLDGNRFGVYEVNWKGKGE
ncbi:hypothetical protein EJ04DRAFT_553942 [Polyplosphaeria fusca]|uniref:VOC domain-containing protein n=1 Tax=Polyplosphaeria fusca TaxID=682080 RepID=A0A9P4QWZ4_9PLEO|nr:hypothetical protein EJ04DRAFT_553942 [Polyplosphaeria fusca]